MKVAPLIVCLIVSCTALSEGRYKLRRPLPPPPNHQIFKKAWPMTHRMSQGSPHYIGGNFPPKRPPYKPANLRMRRPPVLNVIPTGWKTQGQMLLNNYAMIPQRPPVKEFHAINKVAEYSPEYRPEPMILPPTHRGHIDDDKGPIHTIPAPNLSPADKPYNLEATNQEIKSDYSKNSQGTSVTPQRTLASQTPSQRYYEVTEANELHSRDYYTAQPTYHTPAFESSKMSTEVEPDLQSDEPYVKNQPALNTGLIDTNVQFGQPSAPMQTNLHSSLHVGFPGSAVQAPSAAGNQAPDLHVGHPAAAGPPLSATQLYDLLNSFPQQLTDQYASGQHPQLQQHLLQQQLGHLLQPTANGAASFSQPQMHSFNYNEQENKHQKQQQVSLGPNYAPGRAPVDYSSETDVSDIPASNNIRQNDDLVNFAPDTTDLHENRIEFEQTSSHRNPSTFFPKVGKGSSVSSQFYTTLPSREAAEKLAALAAAGNVNSQLIKQLKKHQDNQQHETPVPNNHKTESYKVNEQQDEEENVQYDQRRYEEQKQQQQQFYQRQKQLREQYQSRHEQKLDERHVQHRNNQKHQESNEEIERPADQDQSNSLKIMIPGDEYADGVEQESSVDGDYEYEEDDGIETRASFFPENNKHEDENDPKFGSKLVPKKAKS